MWDFSDPYVTFDNPGYTFDGGVPAAGGMPNLVGLLYLDAIDVLQEAGIYVPSKIGYFGTSPINILWRPTPPPAQQSFATWDFSDSAMTFDNSGYTFDGGTPAQNISSDVFAPGTVLAQVPALYAAAPVNTPVTLTVVAFPMGVAVDGSVAYAPNS